MAQRVLILAALFCAAAVADLLAAPRAMLLRHDLQLLNDGGVINVPLTAWPGSQGNINNAITTSDSATSSVAEQAALARLREHLAWEDVGTVRYRVGLAGA